MRCPSCRQPASEHLVACAHCGFSLEAVERLLGVPPMLATPLADPTRQLTPSAARSVRATLNSFNQRFPQLSAVCILQPIPAGVSAEIYAFWLLNKGGLFSLSDTGGRNHGLLLLLDSSSGQMAAIIGYGLEPFINETHLAQALEAAGASLDAQNPARAAHVFFREFSLILAPLASMLPRVFGYDTTAVWRETSSSSPTDPATYSGDLY